MNLVRSNNKLMRAGGKLMRFSDTATPETPVYTGPAYLHFTNLQHDELSGWHQTIKSDFELQPNTSYTCILFINGGNTYTSEETFTSEQLASNDYLIVASLGNGNIVRYPDGSFDAGYANDSCTGAIIFETDKYPELVSEYYQNKFPQ